MWKRSSSWPPVPGCRCRRKTTKRAAHRSRLLEINRCAARYFYEQLNANTPEAAAARRYWKEKRGLSDAAIRRFGLGYAPDDFGGLLHYLRQPRLSGRRSSNIPAWSSAAQKGNLYDIFRHRVMVPIIDVRGNIIAFGGRVLDDSKPKYINSPETMVYKKSRTLFALNVAKKSASKRFILCEGYMDVISMHEAGFDTAVCACGTALTAGAGQTAQRICRGSRPLLRLGRGRPEGHRAQPAFV